MPWRQRAGHWSTPRVSTRQNEDEAVVLTPHRLDPTDAAVRICGHVLVDARFHHSVAHNEDNGQGDDQESVEGKDLSAGGSTEPGCTDFTDPCRQGAFVVLVMTVTFPALRQAHLLRCVSNASVK